MKCMLQKMPGLLTNKCSFIIREASRAWLPCALHQLNSHDGLIPSYQQHSPRLPAARRCNPCHSTTPSAAGEHQPSTPKPAGSNMVLNLPTSLTIGRVAAIPFLVWAWYWQSPSSTVVATAIFIGASITDWMDGYLARKLNMSSAFGAFLDPVADKLTVAVLLILLCTQPIPGGPLAGNNWLIPVNTMAIIGREITMSALREWAATLGPDARQAVAVSSWGKWKTACQMVSLTLLLLSRDGGDGLLVQTGLTLGPPLLCVAAFLTVYSLALYINGLWKHML